MGKYDDLAAAIEDALQAPTRLSPEERRRQLIEAYRNHGHGNVQVTRTKCINALRDTSAPAQVKLVAIRILDLLMDLEDHALATELVPELTFFFDIAKRKKEKDKSKRKHPNVFGKKASPDGVMKVITAVTELLDKWGRHYEAVTPGDSAHQFAAVRQDLVSAGVSMPSPEDYSCVAEMHIPPEAMPAAPEPHLLSSALTPVAPSAGSGGALGEPGSLARAMLSGAAGELDEGDLKRSFEEVKRAQGVDSAAGMEARARCESLLSKWQHAAQEAVEREDFGEFERLSSVSFRYGEMLSKLETEGPSSVAGAVSQPTMESPVVPSISRESSTGKKSRRRKKSPSPSVAFAETEAELWAVPESQAKSGPWSAQAASERSAWPAERDESPSPWDLPIKPAPEPESSHGPWSAAAQQNASGGTWPEPAGAAENAGTGYPGFPERQSDAPAPGAYGANFGAWSDSMPIAAFTQPGPATAESNQFAGREAFDGVPGDWEDPAVVAELQQQVAMLQQQLRQVQLSRGISQGTEHARAEQLQSVEQRIRQLEPVEQRFNDMRTQVGVKGEVNTQLQRELDHCRRDLLSTRQQTAQVEARIAEREELLADVQRRLQWETEQVAYMEEELRNHGAVHQSLLGILQDADSKHSAAQHELYYIQKAFAEAQLDVLPPRSNVPYGPRSTDPFLALEDAVFGEPSVHQSDELATTSPSALRSSLRGDGGGDLSAVRSSGLSSMEQMPEMQLYSSVKDIWDSTQKMAGSPGALLCRMPPSRRDFTEKIHANYRSLLAQDQGPLYEDAKLLMQMAISAKAAGRCAKLDLEIVIVNRGGVPIQEVCLASKEPDYVHACELSLEPETGASGGSMGRRGTLWPHAQLRFCGQLTARAPFQTGPQVELSYLLPDGMHCRARLRLPLAVNRLLIPVQLDARRFLELWHSDALRREEVAVVCPLSAALRDARTRAASTRFLELGGKLRVVHGLGDTNTNVALASSYPQRNSAAHEVLVQVELGGPGGWGRACRLAVRSTSGAVNRSLVQVLLDVLCDAPDPAVAAGPTAAPAS